MADNRELALRKTCEDLQRDRPTVSRIVNTFEANLAAIEENAAAVLTPPTGDDSRSKLGNVPSGTAAAPGQPAQAEEPKKKTSKKRF